jgi:predicted Zn finger-like uncharacterized protein
MTLSVNCPACQTAFRVPRTSVGRQARCARCDHRFIITGTATAPATTKGTAATASGTAATAPAAAAAPNTASPTKGTAATASGTAATAPAAVPQSTPALPRLVRLPLLVAGLTLGLIALLGGGAVLSWWLTAEEPASVATGSDPGPPPADADPPATEPAPGMAVVPGTPTDPPTPTSLSVPPLPAEWASRLLRPARWAVPLGMPSWTTRAMVGSPQSDPPLAVLVSQPQANGPMLLDLFGMTKGQRLGRYELPRLSTDSPRLALSPSGQRFALESAPNRLTVFALPEYYQIVSDFRLPPVPPKQMHVDTLAAFSFAGDDRLVTINGVGRVEVWALPAMKSLVRTNPTATMQLSRAPLEQRHGMLVSADGQRVAVPDANAGLIVYELTKGKAQGQFVQLPIEELPAKIGPVQTALAYVPDRPTLAVLVNVRSSPRLVVLAEYDLAQRRLVRQATLNLPPQMRPPQWLAWSGPQRYLLGDSSNFGTRSTALVAADDGRLLARFELPNGEGIQTTQCPAGQLWYVAGTPESEAGFLVAVDLPDEFPQPTPRLLLTPWGLLRD